MVYLAVFIFVVLVDFTIMALCKVAKNVDKTLENPKLIKIRSKRD